MVKCFYKFAKVENALVKKRGSLLAEMQNNSTETRFEYAVSPTLFTN